MATAPATDLWRMGAAELARMIHDTQVSSREVVEAHLRRIAAVNPQVNAVTAVLQEQAITAAIEADKAIARGDELGPLHGVPITIKENIDLAGSPTTQGLPAMANAIPPIDAPHVAQLRAAGAIPIARTNLPDFGLRWHTDNALHGPTKNPWDANRTPGGSSGGEAVALATGMSPLGVGNDYGGSLRWPSQCCGTAALKPTLGRVPYASALPPEDGPITLQLFAVQGPMARHVRDLRLALSSMSAFSPRDPWWVPAPMRGPEMPKRVAMCIDPDDEGVHPDVAAGVQRAGQALRDAGYQVDEMQAPMVGVARDTWVAEVLAEVEVGLMPILEDIASPDALQFLRNAFDAVPTADYEAYMGSFAERQRIARTWNEFGQQYPLVLGPVVTMQPFPVGFDIAGPEEVLQLLRAFRLVVTANLIGLPVAVVPVGLGEQSGLPQGVQLIGGRYREDLCLDAAETIEDALGVVTPIDPK